MRDDDSRMECSEELLSGLLDDELDAVEKRAAAVHAASCPHCSQMLGELFAARAALTVPVPAKITLPRAFWKDVCARLDGVDGLIRATDLTPEHRRRPLLSPALMIGCAVVLMLAFVAKALLLPQREMSTQLSRLHLAASVGPEDPDKYQAVGYSPSAVWQPMQRNLVNMDGVMVLQTIYSVGGLAVSVFRIPHGSLDIGRLVPAHVGNNVLYLGAIDHSTMAAMDRDGAWDVVIARSPMEYTISLALGCPRALPTTVSPY